MMLVARMRNRWAVWIEYQTPELLTIVSTKSMAKLAASQCNHRCSIHRVKL